MTLYLVACFRRVMQVCITNVAFRSFFLVRQCGERAGLLVWPLRLRAVRAHPPQPPPAPVHQALQPDLRQGDLNGPGADHKEALWRGEEERQDSDLSLSLAPFDALPMAQFNTVYYVMRNAAHKV